MSRYTVRFASAEDSNQESNPKQQTEKKTSLRAALARYAIAGFAAALLLSLVEWIDLNIQLTPVFDSFTERLIFTAYFSLNLLIGSIIGLLVGLAARIGSLFKSKLEGVIAQKREPKPIHNLVAGLIVSLIGAALFYLIPEVFRFSLGNIREAEKISLARTLLRAERLFVYLSIAGLLVSCWILWAIARASGTMRSALRYGWLLLLILFIAAAYYVDSRIEVQQYQYSLHRTMFLIAFALTLTLVASLYSAFYSKLNQFISAHSFIKRIFAPSISFIIIAAVVFTFFHFDKNQNLKTQIFFRSTQAKQFFNLARWALDFDRDGYSALLGGGDLDDTRADINPARAEIIADGIDNNCAGGDLTEQDLTDWMQQHQLLNTASNPDAKRFNVIFIFIDTVRADHLSVYGYQRNTSPNLAKLAERASVFENAFTPSPYTFEAMPKFMKSSYWDAHVETWTEVLARNGYDTILFPRRTQTMLRYIKGISHVVRDGTKGLKQTVDAAINTLAGQPADKPFAAFIYSSDPHMPYIRHKEFDFGSSLADLYDGEIAFTDYHLGRLFDWLKQSGRINDTIVVVMADHGESLGERAVYKHTSQLYNEQARVPMIINMPGLPARRISDYVSTIDLGSTILNAVGIACPKEYTGVSLLPLLRGEPFTRPPVYGEQTLTQDSEYIPLDQYVYPDTKKFMVITQDGYKLIFNREAYSFELFNLKDDPTEQRNLYDRMPEKAAAMKQLLGRFIDVVSVSRPPDADEKKYDLGLRKANR